MHFSCQQLQWDKAVAQMLIIFVHEGHRKKLKFNLLYNYHYILEITYIHNINWWEKNDSW